MSFGQMDIKSGNSKYLKIESGKPVTIHILTRSENVSKKYTHFDGKSYISCDGETCDKCEEGLKQEQRFEVKVLDRADGKIKQFDFGPNIAIGIREIARVLEMDQQTIHSVDLYISRISDKPVRYQVVQRKMTVPPTKEEIAEANLPF